MWSFETYRKALFLSDLAWLDCDKLLADQRGRSIVWQLLESAGSVSANIEEGYGRGFGKNYAQFLRTAPGSARETRGWYWRGRRVFDPQVLQHRLSLADEVIAALVLPLNNNAASRLANNSIHNLPLSTFHLPL